MKEFLDENTFNIVIKKDYINIQNYQELIKLEANNIILTIDNKKIIVFGNNLQAIKLLDKEILIKGIISKLEFR